MSKNLHVNLVLNINTPQFFENRKAVKRPLDADTSFVTISKKRKISKVVGRAFRPSAKAQKLKINSFLNSKKNIGNGHVTENFSKEKVSNKNVGKKSKVTFNTQVEVFPLQNSSKNNVSPPPKLLKPDYISNKSVYKVCKKPEANSNNKLDSGKKVISKLDSGKPVISKLDSGKPVISKLDSGKPVISSLFKKNPEIPKIEKTQRKGSSFKTFSTTTFSSLNVSPKLISTVEKFGYTAMTQVQQLSIPVIIDGHDALIKSQTGSGKTLSYALPIVHKLMTMESKISRNQGVYALVIVPTRELAVQSYQWFEKLCKTCIWVVPGYLIGGEKKKAEKARIRKGINILVATPGRLIDHIDSTNSLGWDNLQYLVLDEADRMLDMGYEQSIKSIIHALNKVENSNPRQTIMLSATLTYAVEKLADITLKSPKTVDVTIETTGTGTVEALNDEHLVTPENLTHHFMIVPAKVRLVSLAAFIVEKCKFSGEQKMLVFMTTQDMVDYHTSLFAQVLSRVGKKRSNFLEKRALKVLSGESDDEEEEEDLDEDQEDAIHFMKLHGSMNQPERTAVFKSFHEASSGVLLCTDVASRGLDLPQVNWIVQYNPAWNPADYVHRVGRTARVDTEGSAVVFINPAESTYISMLEKLGIEFNEMRMENTLNILSRPSLYDKNNEKLPQSMEVAATRFQDKFENAVESDKDMYNMAVQGYMSFVRSYAAIPKSARENFCFKLLHLGHYAKSFALRDPPAVLGSKGSKKFRNSDKAEIQRKRKEQTMKKERTLIPIKKIISEFDSGLDDLPRKRKKISK